MKKVITMLSIALCLSGSLYAQNISKTESKSLTAFLSQSAAKGGDNAEALHLIGKNPAACPGVKVENGHVVEIDWRGKNLAGTLDLSSFPALRKVDVTDNKITALTVANNPSLQVLNAGRNRLTSVDITGCGALQQLRLNRNALSQINLTDTPLLQILNVASNLISDLDISTSAVLKSIN